MWTFVGGAILSVVLVTQAIGAQACSPDPQPPGSTPNPSPSPLPPSAVFTTRDGVRFQVETVLTGLEIPWSLAFAPDGRLFVTERPGRVRIVNLSTFTSEVALTLERVRAGRGRTPRYRARSRSSRRTTSCISTTPLRQAEAPSTGSNAIVKWPDASVSAPFCSTAFRHRRFTTAAD